MAKLKTFMNYIIGAFSLMSLYQEPIKVEKTSIEQYWQNVGSYIKSSMNHHEQELANKPK
jgi:hypothetical protein